MPLIKVEFVSVVLSMLSALKMYVYDPDGRSDEEAILAWPLEKLVGRKGRRRLLLEYPVEAWMAVLCEMSDIQVLCS